MLTGDNERTARAVAAEVGIDEVRAELLPEDKVKAIEDLVAQYDVVAMIGDGVNDILAVKKAQLGIAMQSGSSAIRNVADMVLLDDSFSALRPALQEGRRIITGVTYAMCLFLTRVAVATLVIVAISILGLGFPFEPAHVALTYLTAGIPSFFLILWAKPEARQDNVLWPLVRFVVPAATVTTLFGVALYMGFYIRVLTGIQTYDIPPDIISRFREFAGMAGGLDRDLAPAAATIVAQTVLSIFLTMSAFALILFLAPSARVFTGWRGVSSDRRPAYMALGLFVVLTSIVITPALAHYFALFPLGIVAAGAIAVALLLWGLVLRLIWRKRLLERLLALDKTS
jgi:cation-transporting ATPase E